MKTVLTIAGSDSGGGAGIQADLKTFEAHGLFGMSVITSVTAQNTLGVQGVWDIPPQGVEAQLAAIFDDLPVDAIKIGMLSNNEIAVVVGDFLESRAHSLPIVLDPVMVATSGDRLLTEEAVETMISRLFPLATLVTPNIREAEVLSKVSLESGDMVEKWCETIYQYGPKGVLITDGDGGDEAEVTDTFYNGKEFLEFRGERIVSAQTHGTGCTLSSAIAANLARGVELVQGIRLAREYVRRGIQLAPGLGRGHGPLRHSKVE
ncbi:MAG: bifunctional hydroxymethylpyrimidine kinase/phosphomethylpyrimidine kinase [Ignavibacteriae bacterium]|nr:bifunctional hydroxymethylpyrimidine kinase/phosphomethylpyrimidine kinase [Ignavibacteriota bacterium]MCB9217380.1 bifunctional hydroxymethylpyrimidine kinase/phosphomethylpyrimidine kinase [Ignavibacteria bacterium]